MNHSEIEVMFTNLAINRRPHLIQVVVSLEARCADVISELSPTGARDAAMHLCETWAARWKSREVISGNLNIETT